MNAGKSPPTRADALRAWAAERLELPAHATPQQARRTFLAQLAEHDFVPYEGQYEAYEALSGAADQTRAEVEGFADYFAHQLVGLVEDFAADFFALPPGERNARWQKLHAGCEESQLAIARLNALAPGLDVVPPAESGDKRHDTLVRTACRTFVLDPLRQPSIERKFWAQAADDAAEWELAGRRLCEAHPEMAQLAPRFFERLRSLRKKVREEDDLRKQRAANERQAARQASATKASRTWEWAVGVGVAIFVITSVRAIGNWASGPTRQSRSPSVHIPTFPDSKSLSTPYTHKDLAEWFNATDEELKRRGGAAVVLFGLDQARKEYRARLRELDEAFPGVGSVDDDSFAREHPEATHIELLQWRLKVLNKRRNLLQLEAEYLYPPHRNPLEANPNQPIQSEIAGLEFVIRDLEQQIDVLQAEAAAEKSQEFRP